MAVAEFDAVVIPAGSSILNGLLNDQVEFPGFGPAEEWVNFKNRGDLDQREGNRVLPVFLPVLFDEQVGGLGRKTRRSDFYTRHFLQILLNRALTDVQLVDLIGHRTVTPRFHLGLDHHMGFAVIQTEILFLKPRR